MVDNSHSSESLPIIDINVMVHGTPEEKQSLANTMAEASRTWGFMYLKGHKLSSQLREKTFAAAKRFFELPASEKSKIPIKAGGFTRGYIGVAGESGSYLTECKEAFSYGYNWDEGQAPKNALQGPNSFPPLDVLPQSWRDDLHAFYDCMVDVAELLVKALSLSIGEEETYLSKLCTEGASISLMRFFHYFEYANRPKMNNSDWIGSSPHTDWGFCTLLIQDEAGGLQLQHPKTGAWVDAPYVEDTILVNCGDYLQMFSQGKIKSPLHRVVMNPGMAERFSMVFFYYPSFESKIDTGCNPQIDNVEYGSYLINKWDSVFRKGGYSV